MRHLKAYENQIFASLKMFSILASLFDFLSTLIPEILH